jgi:aspartyl-tRNA(Asn)/glutamyl-tRNA(Gln) amidotransferase subunit A
VAQLLGVIAGHDPEDPWSAEVPIEDFGAQLDAGVRPLRFAIPDAWVFDDCDREVVAAVEGAAAVLAGLGARRVEVNGRALGEWWIANITIILGEAAAIHRDQFLADPAGFGRDVRTVLAAAMELRAHEYVRAAELRQALRHGAGEERLFGAADILLMPATPTAARRIVDVGPDDLAGDLSRNTGPFNLSGHPALSVPCGRTAAGLPIGLQMVGRHWDESTLIRAAAAYERARGPWPMPPIAHADIGA